MSTKTKAKAKAKATADPEAIAQAIVGASTKVASAISAQVKTAAELVSKKRLTSETIRAEAIRLNISDDHKKIRAMVMASWVLAHKESKNLVTEQDVKAYIQASQPDVSKVMTLAYPANNEAKKEIALTYAHNDSLPIDAPTSERIGEGKLLRIARGELTFKDAIKMKQDAKVRPKGLDSILTPFERFKNVMVEAVKQAKVNGKDRITESDARKALNEAIVEYLKPSNKK